MRLGAGEDAVRVTAGPWPAGLPTTASPYKVVVRGTRVVVSAPQRYNLVVTGPGLVLTAPANGVCANPP